MAERSPTQCPAGSRVCGARSVGAFRSRPDSHSSSRPSASPVQTGDRRRGVVGGLGLDLLEDRGGSSGVAVDDGRGDLAQRSRGQLAGPAGGGEQGQVLAFHRAVEGPSQGVQVGALAVAGDVAELAVLVDVDAVLGQQRRKLAQHVAGHPGLVRDLRTGPRGFGAAPSHVAQVAHRGSAAAGRRCAGRVSHWLDAVLDAADGNGSAAARGCPS